MFGNLILTNNGLEILNNLLSGDEIKFSTVKMGKAVNAPLDIANLTDVQETMQTLTVQRANKINENETSIGCNLMGADVTEAFNWSEIGIFAENITRRSVPVLFSYVHTDQPIPIPVGGTVVEMLLDFTINVGNSENVNIELDGSLVFVNQTEMNTAIEQAKAAMQQDYDGKIKTNTDNLKLHVDNKNNPHSVTKDDVGLGKVGNYGKATDNENIQGIVDNKVVTPAGVKKAIESYGVISTGNVKVLIQNTQPAVEAGKTIIWIDTSS